MKIVFHTVKTNAMKVQALLQTIDKHFAQKEKIKILVPDIASLQFISDLLWNYPLESFRPHSIQTPLPFQDLILLSLIPTPENCSFLFNLSPAAYPFDPLIKVVYELEDLTHPQKSAVFQKKFQVYQNAGLSISSSPIH